MTETMAAGQDGPGRKPLNLGLQGGGAHGAFTWGVLDKFLEADCFDFEGIVGTSAGAMNAVVLGYGLKTGGPEHARALLNAYWSKQMELGAYAPWPSPMDRMRGDGNMPWSPMFHFCDALTRVMSPYQLNPMGLNLNQQVIDQFVDFDELRRNRNDPKIFLCATNVLTGRVKVFEGEELSDKAVAASACIPTMSQAVEVDGEYYWDGGYMGNPPLFPIFYNCECPDLLVVQLTPVQLEEVPKTPTEIFDRITSLSFNSSLMREMRVVHFVKQLVSEGYDRGGELTETLIHTIDAEEHLRKLDGASMANLDPSFITWLFELGRERAAGFLDAHFDKVGKESTTDIMEKFG